MKRRGTLLALFVAGIVASFSIAAATSAAVGTESTGTTTTASTTEDGGKGKGKAKGKAGERGKAKAAAKKADCKPRKSLVVSGDYVAASADGFTMLVKKGNKAGRQFKDKQVSVVTDAKTRIQRNGKTKTLEGVAAGWRVQVQGFSCKADTAALKILARRVQLKQPKAADDDGETTTTTTATTTDTTTTTTTTGTTTTTS